MRKIESELKADISFKDGGVLKDNLWSFARRRAGLIAVCLVWTFFYVHSEFHGESASYQGGGFTLTWPIFGLFLFNLIVFIVCLVLVIVNLVKQRFSWRDSSFILMSLIFARVLLHVPYIHAGMAVKAIIFSQAPSLCEPTQSAYLNQAGFKYCYEWMSYPEARFIVVSPEIKLTDVDLSKYPSENWPSSILNEFEKEKSGYKFLGQCGYKEVYKLFNNTYYMRVFCE